MYHSRRNSNRSEPAGSNPCASFQTGQGFLALQASEQQGKRLPQSSDCFYQSDQLRRTTQRRIHYKHPQELQIPDFHFRICHELRSSHLVDTYNLPLSLQM